MKKKCPHCTFPLEPYWDYCPICGDKIDGEHKINNLNLKPKTEDIKMGVINIIIKCLLLVSLVTLITLIVISIFFQNIFSLDYLIHGLQSHELVFLIIDILTLGIGYIYGIVLSIFLPLAPEFIGIFGIILCILGMIKSNKIFKIIFIALILVFIVLGLLGFVFFNVPATTNILII